MNIEQFHEYQYARRTLWAETGLFSFLNNGKIK